MSQPCPIASLPFRVYMGLRATHRNESQSFVTPRASGGPGQENRLESRIRGNDVTFEVGYARIMALGPKEFRDSSFSCSERRTAQTGKLTDS